jgi:hypothetical protein
MVEDCRIGCYDGKIMCLIFPLSLSLIQSMSTIITCSYIESMLYSLK